MGEMSAEELAVSVNRSDEVRRSNDRIAERAEQLHFVSRVPMLCECGQPGCSQIVLITLEEYAQLRTNSRHYLTASDHILEGATVEARHNGYWLQGR